RLPPLVGAPAELLRLAQHLLGVERGIDRRPHARDPPVAPDEERDPLEAPDVLLHAVGRADRAVVRCEGEREEVLLRELGVARLRVGRYADDADAVGGEATPRVAERARLLRASRRGVLRIEVDDHGAAAQLAEAHLVPG